MTDEEHSETKTEEDYEGEEAFDDEGTLDEEEMLSPEENYQDELRSLQDDANLSIEELRQKYCTAAAEVEYDDGTESPCTSDDARKSEELDDPATTPDVSEADLAGPSSVPCKKEEQKEHGYFSDVEDNEDDSDYVPPDPWRRNIRQGPIYQASVPDSIITDAKSPEVERETLLWTPHNKLSMKKIEEFLKGCYDKAVQDNDSPTARETCKSWILNRTFPLKDDEDALKALIDAKYNTNAALASYPFLPANAPLRSVGSNFIKWTDQDCELFERGMQMYGKNFYEIKKLLPHRTVGEIVHFYYIWKKTERHDMFEERVHGVKNQKHPNCTYVIYVFYVAAAIASCISDASGYLNKKFSDFMGGLLDRMDEASGGNVLDITSSAIPANVDMLASKDWRECWQSAESDALPHLDSDTIANVLQ